jgi:hypothetical protein
MMAVLKTNSKKELIGSGCEVDNVRWTEYWGSNCFGYANS